MEQKSSAESEDTFPNQNEGEFFGEFFFMDEAYDFSGSPYPLLLNNNIFVFDQNNDGTAVNAEINNLDIIQESEELVPPESNITWVNQVLNAEEDNYITDINMLSEHPLISNTSNMCGEAAFNFNSHCSNNHYITYEKVSPTISFPISKQHQSPVHLAETSSNTAKDLASAYRESFYNFVTASSPKPYQLQFQWHQRQNISLNNNIDFTDDQIYLPLKLQNTALYHLLKNPVKSLGDDDIQIAQTLFQHTNTNMLVYTYEWLKKAYFITNLTYVSKMSCKKSINDTIKNAECKSIQENLNKLYANFEEIKNREKDSSTISSALIIGSNEEDKRKAKMNSNRESQARRRLHVQMSDTSHLYNDELIHLAETLRKNGNNDNSILDMLLTNYIPVSKKQRPYQKRTAAHDSLTAIIDVDNVEDHFSTSHLKVIPNKKRKFF